MKFPERIYTYEELVTAGAEAVRQHGDCLSVHELGISHDDRKIYGYLWGEAEDCLIVTAGIHGRESVNPALIIQMMELYCRRLKYRYGEMKVQMNQLLSRYSILFIPLLNPDGYEIAVRGFDAIRNPILRETLKSQNIPANEWKGNARGVDINRNFPCRSYNSRGEMTAAASEKETQALLEVFKCYPQSVGYLDFHSRGRIIYYYRSAMPMAYNRRGKRIAKRLRQTSGYKLGKRKDESGTIFDGGNSVQYYSECFERPAITIETLPDEAEFPLDADYYAVTYPEIVDLPIVYLNNFK